MKKLPADDSVGSFFINGTHFLRKTMVFLAKLNRILFFCCAFPKPVI